MGKEHQEERCGHRRSARIEPIRTNGSDAKPEQSIGDEAGMSGGKLPRNRQVAIARVRRKAGVLQADGRQGSGPIDPKDEYCGKGNG